MGKGQAILSSREHGRICSWELTLVLYIKKLPLAAA